MVRRAGRFFALLCVLSGLRVYADEGRFALPPVPPAPTPLLLGAAGRYYLTANVIAPAGAGAPAIVIAPPAGGAPRVELDLNGFVVNNAANPGFAAISVPGPAGVEVIIRNGSVTGGLDGIAAPAGSSSVTIESVNISAPAVNGIHLTSPAHFVIRGCSITGIPAGTGILIDSVAAPVSWQGTIAGNQVRNSLNGITVAASLALKGSVIVEKNQLNGITATAPTPGALRLVNAEPCLVSENTIENVTGTGVYGADVEGCKLVNNVLSDTGSVGIVLDAVSQDNFLIHNVVRGAFSDGVLVLGARNHIDQNVLNANGAGGNVGFGLHIAPGAIGNRIGRNSATGNSGNPGVPCAAPATADYCDETGALGANTFTFGDNLMPGPAKF